MRYYRGAQVRILHPAAQRQGGIISRTGYTGEDGFELSLGAGIAPGVWEVLMEMGQPLGVVPAGLGARDTLRLEAGMPLYGHELSEQINPFQAGLGFACHLVGYDFPGRDALLRIQSEPPQVGPHRAGNVRQAGRPAGLPDPGRRPAGRRSHQRQLFAHARQADRHGLRRPGVCQAGHRAADRHPRPRRAGPGGRMPFYRRKKSRPCRASK